MMSRTATIVHPRKVSTVGADVEQKKRVTRIATKSTEDVECNGSHDRTNLSKDVLVHGGASNDHSQASLKPLLLPSQSHPHGDAQKIESAIKIDCTKRVLSSDVSYAVVNSVINSWEQKILRIPNWSLPTGESFLRHIFRLAPPTITLFGFPADTKYDDPKLSENTQFTSKGARLIKAIDMAVMFLGPDLEPFEEELYALGYRHTAMKARPEHWPVVGEALLCTFEDCMKGGFTQEEREAWTLIYNFMGFHMITGLKAHLIKRGEWVEVAPEKQVEHTTSSSDEASSNEDPSNEDSSNEDPSNEDPSYEIPNSVRGELARQLSRSTTYRHLLRCAEQVPLSSISYDLVGLVIDSWKHILTIPNWSRVTGDLFLRYIFKLEPKTIQLFSFPDGTDYLDPELVSNINFTTKGVLLIKAIDTSVQLLGPDMHPLEGVLYDLGKRHVIMKAQPEYWPIVGEALFLVFEECMGKDVFTPEVREAWTVIYNFLGFHMIKGLRFQYAEMAKNKAQLEKLTKNKAQVK